MKRFLFIVACVAISCGALIGQSKGSRSSTLQVSGRSTASAAGDYRNELRNERREAREKRREQRLAEYEHYIDSLVLSHNFEFNPQTMQQQPAGQMRIVSNPNFNLAFWNSTVDICLPYLSGFTPPYRYSIINYTLPEVSNMLTEQTKEGWIVSFNTTLFSAQNYTFTLEIFSREGGGTLTISSAWYNSVQYSGTITGLY